MMTETTKIAQANSDPHVQRWVWFIDVVFGAIVALGIAKYEPVVRSAWQAGLSQVSFSLFIAISICSFVVYDIAVYHALVKKFPYKLSMLGFVRFYLDLVMAFILYVLLISAFAQSPDWVAILTAVSCWHIAAVIWHIMARCEHPQTEGWAVAVLPHVAFIALYWVLAGLFYLYAKNTLQHNDAQTSDMVLVLVSTMILFVSFYRWNQVLKKIAT